MTIKTQNELYEGYKLSIPQMVEQFNIKSFETLKFETRVEILTKLTICSNLLEEVHGLVGGRVIYR